MAGPQLTPSHPFPSSILPSSTRAPTAAEWPILGAQTTLPTPPRTPSKHSPAMSFGSGSNVFFQDATGPDSSARQTPSPLALLASMKKEKHASLDRYANTYRPLWLRTLPPPVETRRLPPIQPFPDQDYARLFLPQAMFHSGESPPAPRSNFLGTPLPIALSEPLNDLRAINEPGYYMAHFSGLLSLVYSALTEEFRKAILHSVPLHPQKTRNPTDLRTYAIDVPGIREDFPRLAIGDRVILRGLYMDQQAPSTHAIEAEVVAMIKAKGRVFVRAPELSKFELVLPKVDVMAGPGGRPPRAAVFQVEFKPSTASLCAMQDAVHIFDAALALYDQPSDACDSKRLIAKRWLFPDVKDVPPVIGRKNIHPTPLSPHVDQAINKEQSEIVWSIVSEPDPRVPYLISGPPGTGKTKTIVEAVLQVLRHQPFASILLCAPSKEAADTLTQRLGKSLNRSVMLRLNAQSRSFAEVPDAVLPFCCVSGDSFSVPSYEDLLRIRVVVTTCNDSSILATARASNSDTMKAELELHRSLHPAGFGKRDIRVEPHFTHVIIDEAGQASEPEILVPLSVVLPLDVAPFVKFQEPVVVLCGDVHQLGPIIPSPQARHLELDVSLLERLFQREVYSSHPMARGNGKMLEQTRLLEQIIAECYRAPFANLIRNYRSISPLLMLPSALFYEDTLIPAATDVSLIRWSGLPNANIPIAFIGTDGDDDWVDEGASWHNQSEIDLVIGGICSLLAEQPHLRQEDIAVITPWREQVWRFRAQLRDRGLYGIDVGNVETYQGREFRVTFLSCVRSRSRFLDSDRKASMGFVNERKRLNVALTRAKELLVICGNANLLKVDPHWRGILEMMMRNNLYRGPELDIAQSGAFMSKLESSLRFELDSTHHEAGLTLVGSIAREVLQA